MLIEALSSGVIIVGALEWFERQRWRQAEAMTLRSLAFTTALLASGWSAPRNVKPPDLQAKSLCQELRKAAGELEEFAKKVGDFYELPKNPPSGGGSMESAVQLVEYLAGRHRPGYRDGSTFGRLAGTSSMLCSFCPLGSRDSGRARLTDLPGLT